LTAFNAARSSLVEKNLDENNAFVSFKNFDKDHVVATFDSLNKFLSQIYEDARTISVTNTDGTASTVDFVPPEFRVLLLNKSTSYNKSYIGTHGLYNEWIRTIRVVRFLEDMVAN
jgi:hypothetical protein